jgi:hypothetical protein
LGELPEARDLLRQALASGVKNFPVGHPTIATDQNTLATLLYGLGEKAETLDLMQKAYSATLTQFGQTTGARKVSAATWTPGPAIAKSGQASRLGVKA